MPTQARRLGHRKLKTENRKLFFMQVYVNEEPVELLPGMTVRHALIKAGLLDRVAAGLKVYDEWGNELGLAGALSAGNKIWVR